MKLLEERGAILSYHDDYVPEMPGFGLTTRPLDEVLADSDVVVIVTVHPELDIDQVLTQAPLIVDFRGVTSGRTTQRVVRL